MSSNASNLTIQNINQDLKNKLNELSEKNKNLVSQIEIKNNQLAQFAENSSNEISMISEISRLKETIKQMENNYKKNSLSANASHLALQNINQDLTNQLIASENENKKILEQIEPKNMQINKLLEISHSSSSSTAEIRHLNEKNIRLEVENEKLVALNQEAQYLITSNQNLETQLSIRLKK